MWSVDQAFLENQQKVRGKCNPLVNHVCSLIHEQLRREKLVFLGAPWPAWTLDLTSVKKIQATEKLGGKKQVSGGSVIRKPGMMFVPPSVVEQNVKRKPGLDLENLPKTVSLEQVKSSNRKTCATWRLTWLKSGGRSRILRC